MKTSAFTNRFDWNAPSIISTQFVRFNSCTWGGSGIPASASCQDGSACDSNGKMSRLAPRNKKAADTVAASVPPAVGPGILRSRSSRLLDGALVRTQFVWTAVALYRFWLAHSKPLDAPDAIL